MNTFVQMMTMTALLQPYVSKSVVMVSKMMMKNVMMVTPLILMVVAQNAHSKQVIYVRVVLVHQQINELKITLCHLQR